MLEKAQDVPDADFSQVRYSSEKVDEVYRFIWPILSEKGRVSQEDLGDELSGAVHGYSDTTLKHGLLSEMRRALCEQDIISEEQVPADGDRLKIKYWVMRGE